MDKVLVEIKAKVPNLNYIKDRIIDKFRFIGVFHQVDTYFNVSNGRLKIREVDNRETAQLVYYVRENESGPKKSIVKLAKVCDVESLKSILKELFGIKVVVDKIREIYFFEDVEVHLDRVKGLGEFIEFELEVEEKNFCKGKKKLEKLMEKLGIKKSWLVKVSYSDLLVEKLSR